MAKTTNEKLILTVEVEDDNAVESIDSIRKSTRQLTQERNALNLATEDGRKRAQELNKIIDENNQKIKENVSGLEKQRQNVGNYTRSILDAIPGLKGFTGGINGMGAALKANPIGLAITAFLSLKTIFEKNAVVADNLSFAFSGLTKGIGSIVDTIVTTVSSFDKLTTAISNPFKFFKDLANGTADAAREGFNAAKAIDEFTVAQAKANQEIKIADVQIQALEKTLKDRTKTEQERIGIANQIADLEIKNSQRKEELAKQELANEQLKLKGKTLSGEEEAKIIDLQTQVFIEGEEAKTAAAQRQTRINILLAKEEAAEKIAIKKQSVEEINALTKKQIDEDIRLAQEAIQAEIDKANFVVDTTKLEIDEEQRLKDEAAIKDAQRVADESKRRKQSLTEAQQTDIARLNSYSAVTGAISNLAKQGSELQKGLALTSIITDTAAAISALVKNSEANPFNSVTFGAAGIAQFTAGIVRILGNIGQARAILGGAAAGGGNFMTKGPTLLLVGDNPGGVERVTVEPLSGRGQTKVMPNSNLIAMAGGGTLTAGSFETASVSNSIAQSRSFDSIRDAIKSIPRQVLVLQDFERVRDTRDQIETTAQTL